MYIELLLGRKFRSKAKLAYDYGIHANVGVPGARGSESWHHQPVELDGWDTWVAEGSAQPGY